LLLALLGAVGLAWPPPRCRRSPTPGQLHGQPLQRVEVAGDRVRVRQVMDYAEIPAFQGARGARHAGVRAALAREVAAGCG